MALTPDGARLWAMLEKPLLAPARTQPEGPSCACSTSTRRRGDWTGDSLRYRWRRRPRSATSTSSTTPRPGHRARQWRGRPEPRLRRGQPRRLLPAPARLKRVVLIDLGRPRRRGLRAQARPHRPDGDRRPRGAGPQRGDRPRDAPRDRFTFPFFTIEDVAMVDADHIIVANDNNLPFSAGRHLDRARRQRVHPAARAGAAAAR